MTQLKRMGAVLALAGCLFTGLLAGTAMSQARASSSTGVITLRSILSGVIPMVAGGVTGGTQFRPGGTLYWERVNQTTTGASAVPKFSTVYAIPAATLATNGDRLHLHVSVSLSAATTDNKNLQCNIGYSAFNTSTGAFTSGISVIAESSASNSGTLSWSVDAWVTRQGATTTTYEWQSSWGSTATTQGANYTTDSSTITWANANNFLCAVYNTTPGTQTLTLNEVALDWQPR